MYVIAPSIRVIQFGIVVSMFTVRKVSSADKAEAVIIFADDFRFIFAL